MATFQAPRNRAPLGSEAKRSLNKAKPKDQKKKSSGTAWTGPAEATASKAWVKRGDCIRVWR